MDHGERDRDQELRSDLARLRAEQELTNPPSEQLQRIMQRAIARREAYDASPWRWLFDLWSPRFRLSVGGLVLLSAGVASVTMGLLAWHDAPRDVTPASGMTATASFDSADPGGTLAEGSATEASERRLPVRFMLPANGAKSVSVVGDFNAWQTEATPLDDVDGDGVFAATLLLPRGSYGYMFVVDGERWTTDPHATNYRDDGFGQRNAVIRVN